MNRIALCSIVLAGACAVSACSGSAAHLDGDAGAPPSSVDDTSGGPGAEDEAGAATQLDGSAHGDAGQGASDGGSNSVSIIVEPSDDGAALVHAIDGATHSIHMTMYLLSSNDVLTALVNAKGRGVEVKVILNKTFPTTGTSNANAYNELSGNGISVVYAPAAFTFTHEKCVIIDGREAWIMTMNATKSSPSANREYLAIDDEAADVAEAEAVFEADFANKSYLPNGPLLVAPSNARDMLLALIASATQTIDVEGEELSDPKIAAALAAKAKGGAAVRVVVASGSTSPSQAQAIATLKQGGAHVVTQSTPYIHAKALVVDGVRAYVGSANFSTGSLLYNRELGLIVARAPAVAKVASAIATDFASGTAQ